MTTPSGPQSVDAGELAELRAEKAQLEALLRTLPDISFVLDRQGRYVRVLGGSDRTMYSDGKVLEGQTLDAVLPTATAELFRDIIERALDSGELQTIEYPLRVADVSALPEEERASARGQADQWFQGRVLPVAEIGHPEPCVLWVSINITERKRMEHELRRLASTDELTGAANRRTVMERAQREIERCQRYGHPLALLVLDVDHFKAINDSRGHAAGDEVLRRLVNTCGAQLRQSDAFGRTGGEEFLAVLPETTLEGAVAIGERLVESLRELELGSDLPNLAVRISAGGAQLRAGDDLDRLLGRADRAMYAAKAAGRDRLVFDDAPA
jgi:diguanylate cyclase (GGDEF)-like protein